MRARTRAGYGSYSQILNTTTTEDFPGTPASLTFSIRNETCLGITWSPPLVSNGVVNGYLVSVWNKLVRNNNSCISNIENKLQVNEQHSNSRMWFGAWVNWHHYLVTSNLISIFEMQVYLYFSSHRFFLFFVLRRRFKNVFVFFHCRSSMIYSKVWNIKLF